jgi:hypothetical protein
MAYPSFHSTPNAELNYIDDRDDRDAATESTRLLPGNDDEAVSSRSRPAPTPLPKAHLGALVAAFHIVDPIAYQHIFPYINQLLADLRIADPERGGVYSGLVIHVDCLDVRLFPWTPAPWWTNGRRASTVFGVSAGKDIRSVDGLLKILSVDDLSCLSVSSALR